jgi:RNA polymerase sigma-70 factor (ECF subfamily)
LEVTDASGDEAEFRALFDGELSYVLNTLRRLGVREADLPDQTQEVFMVVHALMEDYDRARPLRPWLFGIANRTAAAYRRLARNARELPTDLEARAISDDAPLADEQLARAQARDVAVRALDRIDLPRRSVFILSEIDGVAMPEIARTLDIPLNTAYSRLRLAREEFAAEIKRVRSRERGRA